ncbi:MAG: putative carbohydrate-binding protein with CBM5 and CBM33 domain [Planctomycetota bacterium]|jgi:predicted carbohydrate-binding protein with CBM5 and CBM33 domain
MHLNQEKHSRLLAILFVILLSPSVCNAHGTLIFPKSRVYHVYQANPSNPSFALAASAVAMDGELSYYTWNEVSRNIPAAVNAGLPPGFDYSPWIPDGEIASAGRTDPNSSEYPRTYAGLDQVSQDWPREAVTAGDTISCQFLATAIHTPSVWDVWMTKPSWNPTMPLTWAEMEFLERPNPILTGSTFTFDLTIPTDRSGHHVLWIAWQRDDPVGEVFISTSDLEIQNHPGSKEDFEISTGVNGAPTTLPDIKPATFGDTMSVHFESPQGSYDGTFPALWASVYPTGTLPSSPLGFPEVAIDPFNVIIAFDGLHGPSPTGLTVLPPGGLTFNYAVWPGFTGWSVMFQGFLLAPSVETGHYFTATNGHEIKVN